MVRWGAPSLLLMLMVVLQHFTSVVVRDAMVRDASGSPRAVVFPYSVDAKTGSVLEFSFTIPTGLLVPQSVVFVPDDVFLSLSIEGRDVALTGLDPAQLSDYRHGFRFDIGPHLQRGDNHVVARILNRGGPGGFDVRADPWAWPNVVEFLVCAALLLFLLGQALRSLAWPGAVITAVLAGLAARLSYFLVTPFNLRGHDTGGHMEYIEYILAHGSLPPPHVGWSSYHPPLYYLLAASLWRVAASLGARRDEIIAALQAQSDFYQLGFLLLSLHMALPWIERLPQGHFGRGIASRSGQRALFAALVCLWPAAIVHSARIGNDGLFYLWFAAGMYFANCWWERGYDRDLTLASFFGALGLLTKINAIVLFFILAVLVVARWLFDRNLVPRIRHIWPTIALFFAPVAAVLARALGAGGAGRGMLVLSNVQWLSPTLAVGNRAENYLWFDTKMFVTQPFLNPYADESGRQFFWNYALKSGLFGEFQFEGAWLANLAVVLSALFLLIVAYTALGVALTPQGGWRADLPAMVFISTLFAALIGNRMLAPLSCSADFRYILPALTPLLYVYCLSLGRIRERGWPRASSFGLLVGWAFVTLSGMFAVVLAMPS